jgi:hypothetical protein
MVKPASAERNSDERKPASRPTQSAYTTGDGSSAFAVGSNDHGVFQTGDYASVYIGDYLKQSPMWTRESEKPAAGLKTRLSLAALLGVVADIATVVGVNVGSLHFEGVRHIYEDVRNNGWHVLWAHNPTVIMAFVVALVFTVLPSALFFSRLQREKYVPGALGGYIYERRDGRLVKSRVSAQCVVPHCDGSLKLRRVTVGKESYTATDARGEKVQKTRPIKDYRLVCRENRDHRFPFDRTAVKREHTVARRA